MLKLDTDHVLEVDYLNARGAIVRFDRGSIEVRVMDVQEYATADIAVCAAVIALLRRLCDASAETLEAQKLFSTHRLRQVLDKCVRNGQRSMVEDTAYLKVAGVNQTSLWPVTCGGVYCLSFAVTMP